MKFNPLRDWHYTMNVDSPFDQGSSFLMSLDIISWKANEQNYLEAAIEQLQLLDDHYIVYAYPQLLTTLFEADSQSEKKYLIDSFCEKFLSKIKIRDTILCLHKSKEKKNTSELLSQFGKAISCLSNIESIGGKYKDTFQYRESSIILSYLYALLSSREDFLHAYQNIDDEDAQISNFIFTAYENRFGRLSFIIACRILNIVGHENYGSQLKDHIKKKIDYNNILTEPDLTELIIEAELLFLGKEENNASENVNEEDLKHDESNYNLLFEDKVKLEFYNLLVYTELRDSCKISDKSRDSYFYHQLFSPISTSWLEQEDLKNAFTITCWQFNLLYTFFLRDMDLSAKLFDKILFDSEYDLPLKSIPDQENLMAIYKLKSSLNSINHINLKKVIHNIKSSIEDREIRSDKPLSEEEVKKHTYSPFPNILRWHNLPWLNCNFGIMRDDSMWFKNEDEPFLYLRVSLFGYIASLYLSDDFNLKNEFKKKLLRYSVYNISFSKFYSSYLIQPDHDNFNDAVEKHRVNKEKSEKNTHSDKPFFLGFGSQNQLIIQKVLHERTKNIPRLKSVKLNEDFNFNPVDDKYELSADKSKNELYSNLILPDALYFWITSTYLSSTDSHNQTSLLSRILLHEALLQVSGKVSKFYYGQINFNQDRLSCLLSFPIGNTISTDDYSYFSFDTIDINKSSPRSFLTVQTSAELQKLLNENVDKRICVLKSYGKKPDLYKSIKVLDIINKESLQGEYNLAKSTIDILYKELSSIKKDIELDRYVRLQLVRLINNELLKEDASDKIRETIIYLILEYGGIYDIDLLFNALFFEAEKINISSKNQDLQKKFIYGFYTILDIETSSSSLIESPYEVAYKKNKAEFIKKKLNWLTFLAWKNDKKVILNSLEKCNNIEIFKRFDSQNKYSQKQKDILLTEENNIYIEREKEVEIDKLHSVYYDPNSYTATLMIKLEKPVCAKTFIGKEITISEWKPKEWNILEEIETEHQNKYRDSDWLVDVVGLKNGLYRTVAYPILYCSIEGSEMPFPRSVVDLLFYEKLSDGGVFRLILLSKDYTNPINHKKGHLWSLVYGVNFFVELNEYAEDTLDVIEVKTKNIEQHYKGKKNPSRGLIAYFKVQCFEQGALVLEIEKNSAGHPNFDDENIRIQYDLLSSIKESVKKGNDWVVNPKSDIFTEIKVRYSCDEEKNSRVFNFDDFSWNPFTNTLTKVSKDSGKSIAYSNKTIDKIKVVLTLDNPYRDIDSYQEKLYGLLKQKQVKLEANFLRGRKVRLVNCKLPENLIFEADTEKKINWTDTFKQDSNVGIYSLSPSNGYCRVFFEDFGMGYNGYINLGYLVDHKSNKRKITLHTLKITPIYLSEFSIFFKQLSSRYKADFQIVFIGQYTKSGVYSQINHTTNPNAKEYVFEFGYGRIIILKSDEIHVLGSEINEVSSVLYYGDKLSRIKIEKNIVIVEKIDSGFTRSIYEESAKQKIIHTLYIDVKKKIIKKIIGSNKSGYTSDYTYRNNGNATLSAKSTEYLKEKYSDDNNCEIDEIILYGKVDTESFEGSAGREVIFDIIKLSNKPDSKNEGLMFFKADNIYFENNDYRLKITPVLDKFTLISLDKDYLEKCYISKRDFSANAYKLVNLFNESTSSDILKGCLFLVRVSYDSEKNAHAYSLIGSRESISSGRFQMPFRYDWVLKKQLEEHSVKAIIVTMLQSYRNDYIVELKPGIFISIKPNNNDIFYSGDAIEIREDQGKIFFNLLISSDERYFSQIKFVHILPKNNIRSINLSQMDSTKRKLIENKYFVGADFPNIELQLDENCSDPILLDFFINESKICLVEDKKLNINLPSDFKFVPKLYFADLSNNIIYVNNTDRSKTGKILPAYGISFQETSYNNLIKIISNEKWQYIDKETIIWNNKKMHWDNTSLNNRGYSNSPVPVYIDNNCGYTLRYPVYKFVKGKFEFNTKEISKISLPTQALLKYLKKNKESSQVTVVCSERDTIWLELSPGRIAEINVSFLRLINTDLSLKNLNTDLLSTGDKLELCFPEVDYANDDIEVIELLAWIPSSRGNFNSSSIVPCSDYKEDGSVELGAGIFKMFIPTQDKRIIKGLSYFNPITNYFKALENDTQKYHVNCCMIYIDYGQIKLTIDRHINYRICIQNKDAYLKDWFSEQRINKILELTGNYLPVTIENIDHNSKTICISRKYQNRIELKSNDLLIYNILGKLDEVTLLLRSGFLLFSFEIKEFAKYIPEHVLNNNLINVLKEKVLNKLCLIRSQDGFNIGVGLNELKASTTFKCEFVEVVSDESNSGIIVFNQIHKTLHFIPYQECFWIKPPKNVSKRDVLNLVFRANSKPIQLYAHLNPETGLCSLIETEQAFSEFGSFQKGKNISIDYIALIANNQQGYVYHIVRSKISGVYLLAESVLDKDIIEKRDKATIIYFSHENKNVLVVIGEKIIVMDTYKLKHSSEELEQNTDKEETNRKIDSLTRESFKNERIIEILKWGEENILKRKCLYLYDPLKFILFTKKLIDEGQIQGEFVNKIKTLSVSIIIDIGMRAIRERHSEVLVSKWLYGYNRKDEYGLWGRFNGIGGRIFNGEDRIDKDDYRAVENLHKVAIPLRTSDENSDYKLLGDALMIAIGQSLNISIPEGKTPIVNKLVGLSFKVISKLVTTNNKILIYDESIDFSIFEKIINDCETENGSFFYLRENILIKYLPNEL